MPWLSRSDYENLLRRNDDRDFAAARAEVERVRSDVRALRTWLQRNLDAIKLPDEPVEAEEPPVVAAAVGGWRR